MDKHYAPEPVEARWHAHWETHKTFSKTASASSVPPFMILMPPPNVTGHLHMGHALTFTLQDLLIRYHRMRGKDVWWQPGLDHAGIATQMVVERQMWSDSQTTRHDLGREAFLEKVWAWKKESGDHITGQLKRLGSSTDWDQTCFTLDPHIQHATRCAFVQLYRDGLIYRAQRLVNWDSKLQTALSDLEVVNKEVPGVLYYVAYALEGDALVVATTRPETMFGDTAIAVHPDDVRYQKHIGQTAIIPLIGRKIPIIADDAVDMEKGTGAVKITPAHDFNDYQMGLRHQLPMPSIMDEHARLCGSVPDAYRGMGCLEARDKVVAELEAQGFLIRSEPIVHAVPHGDRSGGVLEPRLTDQWFLDAATLAKPALEAVAQGQTVFVPAHWQHVYEEWLHNIQPWCLSRQIWWGHRIPAWYGPDGHIFVAENEDEAASLANKHYGSDQHLTQDHDVLDTWFSSGLWPFVTQGWPDQTPELARYYPSDVLVTGFDIIFFWVARMMMMGMYFMKRPPFSEVYIHGLIRDAQGQKMSKTKGNVINPLELIQEHGADALRFAMTWSASPGRDIHFSQERLLSSRHFITKIWNAARYIQMQQGEEDCSMDASSIPQPQHIFNRWMITRVGLLSRHLHQAMRTYHFHEYAQKLYHEVWDVFCDWYVELTKPLLTSDTEMSWRQETLHTLRFVFAKLLIGMHPVMPFLTQELWSQMGLGHGAYGEDLTAVVWQDDGMQEDTQALHEIAWLQNVIIEIRSVRNQLHVPASQILHVALVDAEGSEASTFWAAHGKILARMVRVQSVSFQDLPTHKVIEVYVQGAVLHMALGDAVDLNREYQRLLKERATLDKEIIGLEQRLHNQDFRARAPLDVLEQTEINYQQRIEERTLTQQWLQRLQLWLDT